MRRRSGGPKQRKMLTWPRDLQLDVLTSSLTTWSGSGELCPCCLMQEHDMSMTFFPNLICASLGCCLAPQCSDHASICQSSCRFACRHPPFTHAWHIIHWPCLISCLSACRYPSFTDALRDLDDPLTMTHLFATLPAEAAHDIPAKAVQMSRRLALEWQSYVVRTHALRKVFVSVKGFYYQADVLGQQITWLVPHQLAQVTPSGAGAGSTWTGF